jgi:tetratricopeptide (TPR) repeat protein
VFVACKHGRLFFTYNGGPVFNLSVAPAAVAAQPAVPSGEPGTAVPAVTAPANDEPQDAAAYSRRGAALAARREFTAAIADFNRACELAPREPDYFYERGLAHAGNRQPDAALADLDETLKLKPDHIPALLARAEYRVAAGDPPHAIEDLDAADRSATKEADARLRMAIAYAHVDRLPQAVTQLDAWIAAHDADARMAAALNERCLARTLLDQDLPKALDDCNAALKRSNKKDVESAPLFNSRGLVRLRLGDYQKSIADYDAALGLRARDAWALYGRGVDEKRLGRNPAADADMAAASVIWPAVADAFVKHGIHP